MKKLIYNVLSFGLISLFFFSSCKKDGVNSLANNNEVKPSMQAHPPRKQLGREFRWDPVLGRYKFHSYYMRTLKQGPFVGVQCFNPEANCLPDHFVGAAGPKISEPDGVTHEVTQAQIDNMLSSYCNPIIDALGNHEELKLFFNNTLVPNTNFPPELIDDINNDIVTIKEFDNYLYFVNMNATVYDDVPQYNS